MGFFVVCPDASSASRGYETGTFSDARALADTCDLMRGVAETGDRLIRDLVSLTRILAS
jgi:hypothetical protein